ncbi:MAG: heavy metal-binding domain-containing protein [Myxococcota bacterium]|nr:heavy metal-binding domain-containing protein [Myxococcota bacterium]
MDFIIFLVMLLVAFFTGEWLERRHYKSIRSREGRWQRLPAISFRQTPAAWQVTDSGLVMGNTVVSVDYFKRFLAGLRMIFGGRVKSYETLLDRARREALLRLKKDAIDRGFHAVINVRLETSRMANGKSGQGTAGVEILAFGTGLKLAQHAA